MRLAKGNPAKPTQPLPSVMDWVYSGNRLHPTEKAVEIIAPLIRCFSKPGDLVCDPFSGSGSTSVAAALNGRDYLGIDIDDQHCITARARLAGVALMFRDVWENRSKRLEQKWAEQKGSLTGINAAISKLTNRLIETTSASAVKAYESKLEKLESEKALIAENLALKPDISRDFGRSFRTALAFLANPQNLWASDNPLHRKTLLKLVFAAPLPYVRNQGFRTAKTTSPFKALAAISDDEKEMAVLSD